MTASVSAPQSARRLSLPLRTGSVDLARRSSETSQPMSPVQSSSNSQSRINTPSTSIPNTPIIPTRPPSPQKMPLHPSDSNSFLTALAAQERRVLELKEELQKAELDLEKLKKQWASHEAIRKRNEARQLEQLRPLKATHNEMSPIVETESSYKRPDTERRQTLSSSTRSSQRKVFSGSRHARTLSLLTTKNFQSETTPKGGESPEQRSRASIDTPISQSSHSDLVSPTFKKGREPFKSPDKDLIFETGKQLVGDFRQGFWTFVEDLKQVTVGDEASSDLKGSNKRDGLAARDDRLRETGVEPDKTSQSRIVGVDGSGADASETLHERADTRDAKKGQLLSDQTATHSDSENEPWDDWGTPSSQAPKSTKASPFSRSDETSSPLRDLTSSRTNMR